MKNGKYIVITNNPLVNEVYTDKNYANLIDEVRFRREKSQTDILKEARDLIYLGAKLLIHPMMGRVKPHETPYKSVMLELSARGEELGKGEAACGEGTPQADYESVIVIEDSIAMTEKLLNNSAYIKYYDEIDADLQFLDKLLLDSGVEELARG